MLVETYSNGAVKLTITDTKDLEENLFISDHIYLYIPTTISFNCKLIEGFKFIDTHIILRKGKLVCDKVDCANIIKTNDHNLELLECARKLSRSSRLAKDPAFDREIVANLYIDWLKTGDTYIYVIESHIAGYISLKENNITMLYVDEKYRRMGVATKLINHIDCADLTVATLLSNVSAVNLYIKNGFMVEQTFNVFHYHA